MSSLMSKDCDAPGANIMKQQWTAKYINEMQQAILDSLDRNVFSETPCIFQTVVDVVFLNMYRETVSVEIVSLLGRCTV
jgi:hypothetical protein